MNVSERASVRRALRRKADCCRYSLLPGFEAFCAPVVTTSLDTLTKSPEGFLQWLDRGARVCGARRDDQVVDVHQQSHTPLRSLARPQLIGVIIELCRTRSLRQHVRRATAP